MRSALVRSVSVETAGGRARRGWRALLDVARRAPAATLSREFHGAAAKVVLLTVLGYPRYTRLAGRYGRRAAGRQLGAERS
jgi:hypothetical protein